MDEISTEVTWVEGCDSDPSRRECKKGLIEAEIKNVLATYGCRFQSYDVKITDMRCYDVSMVDQRCYDDPGKIKAKFDVTLIAKTESDVDSVFLAYNAAFKACTVQGLDKN